MSLKLGQTVLVILMAVTVVLSNILVHFVVGEWLTYAALPIHLLS